MAPQPQEIATSVYWLEIGAGLTESNVYFVRSRSSWVLIDTGWPNRAQQIWRAAESLFGMNTRPAAILLTHIHPDHSGSATELARLWHVPVYAHPDELPMASGEAPPEYASPLDRWVILPLMRVLPTRARERMAAGASIEDVVRPLDPSASVPGLPDWELIQTPGHTPGHVAFFRRRDGVLLAGDACLTINVNSPWDALLNKQSVSAPPYVSTWSWRTAKKSVAALARLEPRALASGHGAPMTGAATAHELRAFAERFERPGAAARLRRALQEAPAGSSLAGRLAFFLQCELERRSMGLGIRLYRLTNGAITRTFGAQGEVLLLTTRGRKSGERRTVMIQGFRDGNDLVVVASNSGQSVNPGWYYNLKATPQAQVEVFGHTMRVRAEELSADETAAFWPRVLESAPEYARARERTTRAIPFMRLIPVVAPGKRITSGGGERQVTTAGV